MRLRLLTLVAGTAALLFAGVATTSADAATTATARPTAAAVTASVPYLNGTCNALQKGDVKIQGGNVWQCQYVYGLGYWFVYIGSVGDCNIVNQAVPAVGKPAAEVSAKPDTLVC